MLIEYQGHFLWRLEEYDRTLLCGNYDKHGTEFYTKVCASVKQLFHKVKCHKKMKQILGLFTLNWVDVNEYLNGVKFNLIKNKCSATTGILPFIFDIANNTDLKAKRHTHTRTQRGKDRTGNSS